ncbi:MobF family relaxase [Jatrophihabitans lederbergiae]|uniref:MobF family relaxase n=1 Tax=Jatrophihabitans lederbergiae TaxID=3075547 RepID=A0ABU2JCY2_9ACTN|nr:MobF family relaxase [Jatrophihabitans sp. DSM 44399]MDT0262324.1 MobF family relaxase [Jatrophihabitans sp. DSM 44399]
MTVHKLTAGDGYTYLTRQVAAHDATNRGYDNLGAYYDEKGEAPGVWMGTGVGAVPEFRHDGPVTEEEMVALFGEGRHPDANRIERAAIAAGKNDSQVDQATRLGNPYRVYEQANMFHRRSAGAFRDHNIAFGLHADTPVPPEERARIRTDLARTMFVETYGRPPADARELSGHLARISRQSTTAVAGYDLAFSPVKSVSTLWAVAPLDIAQTIEGAHQDAVKDTVTWLENNATYTRSGRNGVAQIDTQGLVAAAFTHRDSRSGDPDLHTHVAISNKVRALDGRWLALDGRPLFKNGVAASERYNTRLEALLIQRLGVQFADRPGDDPSKRPVREIVGVDGPLPRQWSSRRAAIDVRRAVLSAQFHVDHGRPPTPHEAIALAGQANKETRQAKHEPRSYAEQRATWRTEALAVLGGEAGLRDYLRGALQHRHSGRDAQAMTPTWVNQTAVTVLSVVQSGRATWQPNHVRAEAERQARGAGVRLADLDRAVDAVVDEALVPARSMPLGIISDPGADVAEPAPLRRRDGSSVYTVAGAQLYTSSDIIAAEEAIVAAAGRRDGRLVSAETVNLALLESRANGVELNPGQVQMVHELATSGARAQLALAPAGTGKTTAMRVLSRAWTRPQADGANGGRVVGLAPSAAAAAVLREEIDTSTDTIAKLVHALETGIDVPDWVASIGPDTLVVIDEAGMAGTTDLAKAIGYVTERGGSVRLIGDDQQLAATGAGGVLRDVAATHGAVTLSQVLRFTHPDTGAPNHAEGAASLALRDGDSAAIAYYIDNGRVHVGDITTVIDDAFTAWSTDRAAGRDAIMLAPTRDLVAELNDRARRDRLTDQDGPTGREVRLIDHSHASAGDAIITRKNNRKTPITATDWVKNGDRWTVDTVRENGALDVTHLRTGRHITLPAEYVARHVSLGYATTVHGAQGITADASHTVATGQESRQLLYVAMTRGRHANHVYLTTAGDGDPHSVITRDALLPPTAVDILTRVLARDGSPSSATSATRAAADPARRLRDGADQYHDALGVAAADVLGDTRMAEIDAIADTIIPGLSHREAYPALRAHLALLAVDGHHPETVLRQALDTGRGLDDARDVAAVLDWRLDPTGHRSTGTGPLPWLPAIPDTLRDNPDWGRYLARRVDVIATATADVSTRARDWTPTSAPAWAKPIIDRNPDLVADLAVWRAANNVDDGDRRPTGPPLPAAADARAQRTLNERVTRLLGNPTTATGRWAPLADSIDQRITADPYWPTLADRLTVADRAGIDITSLVHTVGRETPLPDEQPAAALWWRLSRHLTPAAMTATDHSVSDTLRPDWTPVLPDLVGPAAAERIEADPAWPGLVAAVTHARRGGWEPEQLLTTAHDLLRSGHPEDEPLRPDELATALVWRIGMLADTTRASPAYLLPNTDAAFDDHWLASLVEPDPSTEPGSAWAWSAQAHHATEEQSLTGYPSDAEMDVAIDEANKWVTALVPRERLVDLNTQAAAFFADHYADAWAPGYVTERLGSDLTDDPRATVGYAPDRWTALTSHLRRHGATDEELVGAGLGSYASTGRVIDRFRDRLVVPIKAAGHDGQTEIHGFIGRRNPAKAEADDAGPKYLNTADTDLFSKSHELYGLVENAEALAAGATPVLVEGPMDAIAVTLAGDGAYVGVAPLGTAFTDVQANALRPYIGPDRPGIIVATDSDRAGQQAALRAFWQLTARGDNPRHLVVANGKDPAELLQNRGADALRDGLASVVPLADSVITARTATWADQLDTVEGRVFTARAAAQVITALPPDQWPSQLASIVARTGIWPDTALAELFDAHTTWSADPYAAARRHLAERLPDPAPDDTAAPTSATSTSGPAAYTNDEPTLPSVTDRWSALAESVTPRLTDDPGWPSLAASLDRAEQTGYDVRSRLPAMVISHPLPAEHVARSVEFRLAEAWPGSIAARNRTIIRPPQPEASPQPIDPAVLNDRPVDRSATRLFPRK